MYLKVENLTENHTILMVSEIHTKQSINEETQVYSQKAFCRKAKMKVDYQV